MNIEKIRSMMGEKGRVGGSLDLEGCTGIASLPDSIDPHSVIR